MVGVLGRMVISAERTHPTTPQYLLLLTLQSPRKVLLPLALPNPPGQEVDQPQPIICRLLSRQARHVHRVRERQHDPKSTHVTAQYHHPTKGE